MLRRGLEQHEPQVAIERDRVRGVFQRRGRSQAFQEGRAGVRGRGQDFLVERPPGRQPGPVGEEAAQGQGLLVPGQPGGRQDLSQGGGEAEPALSRQDHEGQGGGQGLGEGGQVEDRVGGDRRGARVPGHPARGPFPEELALKAHQGHRSGVNALADAGFQEHL